MKLRSLLLVMFILGACEDPNDPRKEHVPTCVPRLFTVGAAVEHEQGSGVIIERYCGQARYHVLLDEGATLYDVPENELNPILPEYD